MISMISIKDTNYDNQQTTLFLNKIPVPILHVKTKSYKEAVLYSGGL